MFVPVRPHLLARRRTKVCSASPQCIGAKHSSLSRGSSGTGSRCATRCGPTSTCSPATTSPSTWSCYGSDYLLGLSTFAPEAFAERDRRWADGRSRAFHELNDLLQYLGALRVPRRRCPAYRHDAALFLHAPRAGSRPTPRPPGAPRRPDSDRAVLADIARAARGDRCDRPSIVAGEAARAPSTSSRDRLRGARHRRPARRRRRGRPDGPLAAPFTFTDGIGRHAHRRQPVRGAADGGLGRHHRRSPDRPRAPALAALRRERRQARLGRRSRRRAARRAGQPAPARDRRVDRRRLAALRVELVGARRRARRDDGLVVGLQLTHSGRWSRPDRRAAAAHRLPPPACSTRRVGADADVVLADDELDELVGALRRRRGARRATPASTSSTSSTATATCSTSCSARSTGPARYGGDVRAAAPRSCARVVDGHPRARARASRSACACRRSTSCPFEAGADGVGAPVADAGGSLRVRVRRRRHRPRHRPHRDPPRSSTCCRELGIGLVVHHRRQPVLQPARPAAGLLPAVRRLPPARGPARRRGPHARRHRRARPRASRRRASSAPATRTSSSGSPTPRRHVVAHGRRGVGRASAAWHAQLPAPARRRARRPPARDRR